MIFLKCLGYKLEKAISDMRLWLALMVCQSVKNYFMPRGKGFALIVGSSFLYSGWVFAQLYDIKFYNPIKISCNLILISNSFKWLLPFNNSDLFVNSHMVLSN